MPGWNYGIDRDFDSQFRRPYGVDWGDILYPIGFHFARVFPLEAVSKVLFVLVFFKCCEGNKTNLQFLDQYMRRVWGGGTVPTCKGCTSCFFGLWPESERSSMKKVKIRERVEVFSFCVNLKVFRKVL